MQGLVPLRPSNLLRPGCSIAELVAKIFLFLSTHLGTPLALDMLCKISFPISQTIKIVLA